jgi:uncharacterized protein YjiS (DUF1127 family)
MERKMSHVIDCQASATRSAAAGVSLSHTLAFFRLVWKRLRERREMNYLLSLPDYQLKDIDLQRGDIQREALKPVWRD